MTLNRGIAICVFTDGRDDVLARTIESLEHDLILPRAHHWRLMFDDTGDRAHRDELVAKYTTFRSAHQWNVISWGRRTGFAGSIQRAWQLLSTYDSTNLGTYGAPRPDWVWHHEDDFTFNRPVDVSLMQDVMAQHPYLVQMALRRQPWNNEEIAAGGIVELHPDWYDDRSFDDELWVEHKNYFTTNPSLYKRSLCERGWPKHPQSEGKFGIALFKENPGLRSAYWGPRTDPPLVEHIGVTRVGHSY